MIKYSHYKFILSIGIFILVFFSAISVNAQCRRKCEFYNACNFVCDGGTSNQCNINADCAEPGPFTFSLSCSGSGVRISIGNINLEDNIDIWRNGVKVVILGQDTTTYTDSGASTGTYRVEAYNFWGSRYGSPDNQTITCDATPPTVTLDSPTAGSTVKLPAIITATATDAGGMSKVEFFLDGGTLIGTVTGNGPTYNYTWNAKTTSNGTHTLSARATDNFGNVSNTSAISINVFNTLDSCTIPYNNNAYLFWTSSNAISCSVYDGSGTLVTTGLSRVSPGFNTGALTSSTTYRIDCNNGSGNATVDTLTVNVNAPLFPPLTCSPPSQGVNTDVDAIITASGGDGTYSWSGGGFPASGIGSSFTTRWSTTGTRTVTVTSASQTATCDVDVTLAPTLTVSLNASPGSVYVGQPTDLSASVGGTATGTVNYNIWWDCDYADTSPTFAEANSYCGAPALSNNCGANQTLGYKCDAQAGTSLTRTYAYSTAGTKDPFVLVERGGLSAMARSSGVTVTSIAPSVVNPTVTVSNSNYCSVGPHATVSWSYSDPLGSPQQAYEALINGGADINVTPDSAVTGLNPSNINPEWRGAGTTSTSSAASGCNAGNTDANPQATCQITWNTTYTAWVRVQNNTGQWSAWTLMGTYCNGSSCNSQANWTTPTQAFPQASFTISPSNPSANLPVTFTDTSTFQGAASPRTWLWNFNYPAGPTQTITNPPTASGNTSYTYTSVGTYFPRLTVTDNLGQTCFYDLSPALSIQKILPRWREVSPR